MFADQVEGKCHKEVQHLQELQRQKSSIDEGLGTLVSTSTTTTAAISTVAGAHAGTHLAEVAHRGPDGESMELRSFRME